MPYTAAFIALILQSADKDGLRSDVRSGLTRMNMPNMRFPVVISLPATIGGMESDR